MRTRSLFAIGVSCLLLAGCGRAPIGTTSAPASPSSLGSASASATASPASVAPSPALEGRIVFEDSGQDFMFSQIWIENADASGLRQLVDDKFTDVAPALSPDGKKVIFLRILTDSLEAAMADPKLIDQLFTVNVDGSGLTLVRTGGPQQRCGDDVEGDSWSPDGTHVVMERYCFDRDAKPLGGGLWTTALDGSDQHQVTSFKATDGFQDHRATWSPDAKRIAFERLDTSGAAERAAIFTINADGTDLFQVTPWALGANDPDWSPNGDLIAFNAPAEPAADQNIYVIGPDGAGLRQLTNFAEAGQATFHPSWSPDGSQLLFSHSPATDGWGDLFVVSADGTGQHPIAGTSIHENHAFWGRTPSG